MKQLLQISTAFLFIACICGCKTGRILPVQIFTSGEYCQVHIAATTQYDSLLAIQIQRDTTFSAEVNKRFTLRAKSVAADVGVQSLLTQFVKVEKEIQHNKTADNLLQMVAIRQEITERVSLASLELTSVLSEINCEIGRATEMKNYLQLQLDKRVVSATILSVLAAATAQVVVSIFSLSDKDQRVIEATEIGGALMSGYFALSALKQKDKKAMFLHKRNFLTEIRDNPTNSTIFLPMVWHYLTKEYENTDKTITVRQNILNRWQELNLLTESEEQEQVQRIQLLFGEGGLYSKDDIDNRISLLDLLAIEVSLMNQELKQLQQEIMVGYLIRRGG
jgi:hypothetical protein